MAPIYNSNKGGFECKAGETDKAPVSDGFIKGYFDDNDNCISIQPSDDIAKIFSTHSFFLVTWTYDATDIKIEKKNITLTDASAPRSLRTRKPSAAANTTITSNPNDGAASSQRGNGNNNSTRHRSTSRGGNSRRDTSNTTSQNNNTTQSQSTSRSNSNTTHPGRGGGRVDNLLTLAVNTAGNTSAGVSSVARSSSLSTAVSISQNSVDVRKQSKKKSKTSTITTPPAIPITQAVINSVGKHPNYNAYGVDMNLFQCGVSVQFKDIGNTILYGRLIYWDKDNCTWTILKDSDGSNVIVNPSYIVGFKEFVPYTIKQQDDGAGAGASRYEVMAIGYSGVHSITPGGDLWNVLLQSDAFKRLNNNNTSTKRPASSDSNSNKTTTEGHGGSEKANTFFSPDVSREKVNNSTGLTPLLGTADLIGFLGDEFDDADDTSGNGGGYTLQQQHPQLHPGGQTFNNNNLFGEYRGDGYNQQEINPSTGIPAAGTPLSLQGYNQTPNNSNNLCDDNDDIVFGFDVVERLKAELAGGISNELPPPNHPQPEVQNLPPPVEEQPAIPSLSNNKERIIDALVTKASSPVVQNVISHPLIQYMLEQSTVVDEIASIDDFRKFYINAQRIQNPNHYIDSYATYKRVQITYHGSSEPIVCGIESFEKAQLARIVVLLVLIPSMKMKISKAKREYEKQRAQLAASLAIGMIGNANDMDDKVNICGCVVDINYNGSKKTGERIQVSCKSKEHAILVRNELCELLTNTNTYIHLSGDQKGNVYDPSVPVGQESKTKVEDVKYLAKERLINTGKFDEYKGDWLAPSWSNAQDNVLKEYVLNGMIGGNVCNKRQQNMNMSARIYLDVDWEAASLLSELKGRSACACESRFRTLRDKVSRDVPFVLRPFYCASQIDEGRRRIHQKKDVILNTILRNGIDDEQEEVFVEEKEEEMEVLAPSQVKSGGDESSNHYDDTTVAFDFAADPVKSGEDDVSTKFEHDMREEEAVEHDDDGDEDLDKQLKQMMNCKDDADIQTAIKQLMSEFGGNGDTLAPFTAPIPKKLLNKSQTPAKKSSEPAVEFYSMQLYERIQNSESTSDVVKQCKELPYDKIRMLFEADMQQFFNNNDKRKSNLYKAVLGRSLRQIIWKDIASQVGTTTAYCKKYWLDSLKAKRGRGKLAKEADEVNVLMRGALTKLLEEHVLIEKSAERESLIGKDVVIG